MSVQADIIKQIRDYGGLDYWWLREDEQRAFVLKTLTASGVVDRDPSGDLSWYWLGYQFGPGGAPP
jgi:hypothetical protein